MIYKLNTCHTQLTNRYHGKRDVILFRLHLSLNPNASEDSIPTTKYYDIFTALMKELHNLDIWEGITNLPF